MILKCVNICFKGLDPVFGKLSQKIVRKKANMVSSAHDFDVVMNDGATKSMSVYKGKSSVV